MADYYPLLTRAIATLPEPDSAKRQAIYGRAREALERQLRGLEPALDEAEILKETQVLEDVIRRIEADYAEIPPQVAGEAETENPPAQPVDEPAQPVETSTADSSPAPLEAEGVGEQAPAEPVVVIQPARSRASDRPKAETRQEMEKSRRKLGFLAVAGGLAMLVMGTFAYLKREDVALYRGGKQPVAEAPRPAEPVDQAKREGRLGAAPDSPAPPPAPRQEATQIEAPRSAGTTTPPNNSATLPVSSRAFMVLEVPGSAPSQFEGQANWSFSPDPASRSGEKAIRSVITYAAAGLTIDFSIAKNRDPKVNSSHVIFVSFEPKQSMPGVREMSAIEWRERESQTGSTLTGMLVPIQDNVFLIGLDPAEQAVERNLELLRNQRWLVFEVRLINGQRGALLIEKGSSGDKAITEALAAWK